MLRIDSTLVLVHNPDMDLRFERESENENQRMLCLEELVGLVLHKEELEKMDKLQSNNLLAHLLLETR